jgi:hypothetical protein
MPTKTRKVRARSTKDVLANLRISDLYLWESSFARETEYMPGLHEGKTRLQSTRHVSLEEADVQVDDEEERVPLWRAFVSFGVRSVIPREDDEGDGEPLVLHTLTATFAIDLFVVDENQTASDRVFAEFAEKNLPLLAWPFWRNHVYDTFKRASLPVPIVPLYGSLAHHEVDDA